MTTSQPRRTTVDHLGNGRQVRLDALRRATHRGSPARYEAPVQDRVDDHDTDGRRRGPWLRPEQD